MAGYSGKPLPAKLGIAAPMRVALLDVPTEVESLLAPWPDGATLTRRAAGSLDLVLVCCTTRARLAARLPGLGRRIHPDGMLWVAWPKRASGVPTDLTEDGVRELALPLGLVDTKVCAVDDTWSGLRLVWRRERRVAPPGALRRREPRRPRPR